MTRCPSCKSTQTRKRSLVWQEGIGVVTHASGNQSTRSSALSIIHSPPEPPTTYAEVLAVAFIFLAVCGLAVYGLLKVVPNDLLLPALAGALGIAIYASSLLPIRWSLLTPTSHRAATRFYERAMATYGKQWVCRSCGEVFVPGATET